MADAIEKLYEMGKISQLIVVAIYLSGCVPTSYLNSPFQMFSHSRGEFPFDDQRRPAAKATQTPGEEQFLDMLLEIAFTIHAVHLRFSQQPIYGVCGRRFRRRLGRPRAARCSSDLWPVQERASLLGLLASCLCKRQPRAYPSPDHAQYYCNHDHETRDARPGKQISDTCINGA
jgi:hypothetical protein